MSSGEGRTRISLVITLEVTVVGPTSAVQTECVLDLNGLGEVIGLEIVNLEHSTGWKVPGIVGHAKLGSGERVRWSYDQEADAFYVAVKQDQSVDQRCARCSVGGTSEGGIASVSIMEDGGGPLPQDEAGSRLRT